MNDEDIEALIAELRGLLNEHGFGWTREQAEDAVDPRWHRRWLAHALIDASETVTVDLAEAELSIMDTFDTDDVNFKLDDGADPDGDVFLPEEGAVTTRRIDRLSGPQRRATLQDLSGQRATFEMLRRRLDGLV